MLPLLLVFATGCSWRLLPRPGPPRLQAEPLPLRAALVVPPELEERVDPIGRFFSLGIVHHWSSRTGEGLVPALEETAAMAFEQVERVRTPAQARDVDVVLLPEVLELRHVGDWGYTFRFRMRARVTDAWGNALLDRVYEAHGEGSRAAAFWGGALLADEVLMGGVNQAMNRVLLELAADLAQLRPPSPPPVL